MQIENIESIIETRHEEIILHILSPFFKLFKPADLVRFNLKTDDNFLKGEKNANYKGVLCLKLSLQNILELKHFF